MGNVYINFLKIVKISIFIHHSEVLSLSTSRIIFYPAVYSVFG